MDNSLFLAIGGLVLGAILGFVVRQVLSTRRASSAEQKIKTQLEEAETRAKEIIIEAKDKAASLLVESQRDEKDRKSHLATLEARILDREKSLDDKLGQIDKERKNLEQEKEKLVVSEKELESIRAEAREKLEKISGLTTGEAKDELMKEALEHHKEDLAKSLQKLEQERRDEVEKKANDIITVALQRYARSHVSELTTTNFHISDEEFKGKIIGREGRNIRALERATGVEFIIDEAPDTIIISSFDPYRREIARMALEKLVKDGRIQPAKIEEKVEEAKAEITKRALDIGEAAAMEVGVYGMPKELLQLLGRLHFRTSFGQNVLTHSIEMAYVASMIAAELGLNVMVAKKGALLHDIGKAIDHEVEGTHVDLGMKLLKKYEVEEEVINAMRSHHDDYPYASPESYVVTAADVLSAARPGARRGTLENYIKRLGDLEKIANEFPGVKNAFAISAGRELRVFVIPEKVDDFRALELARQIANRIQSELKFPGEIKVNVIREMRAVEYAR